MGLRLIIALSVSLLAANAWAEPGPIEAGDEEARAQFEEGAALAEAGDWQGACPRFLRAHELRPTGGTRLRLADCYEHVDELKRARALYQEIIDGAATETKPERIEIAKEGVARIDARLSALEVEKPSPVPSPSPVRADQPVEPGDGLSPLPGGVLLGVGAAGLVVGAIVGGLALAQEQEVRDACPEGRCSPDQRSNADAAESKALGADIAFAIGGAAAATGLVLLIVSLASDDAPVEAHRGALTFRF
jgi:tetratricopeptide (TPR) repeat protein